MLFNNEPYPGIGWNWLLVHSTRGVRVATSLGRIGCRSALLVWAADRHAGFVNFPSAWAAWLGHTKIITSLNTNDVFLGEVYLTALGR